MSPIEKNAPWTALRLHVEDNVATALRDLPAGTTPRMADGDAPVLVEAIQRGHKFALVPIAAGEHAVKYGQPIGAAFRDIAAGAHVHLQNIEGFAGRRERKQGAV